VSDPGDKIDRALADALADLVDSVVRHTTALACARGLAPTDIRAAGLIDRAGAMRPGELARALPLSPSGTTGVINRLAAAGLLHRDNGPANQHDVRLHLTSAGIKELRLAPEAQFLTACDLLALSQTEREIARLLRRVAELVDRQIDEMTAAAGR
jgi:DNA-binding MarR family transcriptional regulator